MFTSLGGNYTAGYWGSATWLSCGTFCDQKAWIFDMRSGSQQSANVEGSGQYGWAVVDRDEAANAISIPAGVWLFGSGLGLLG
jgi:hypothetical protein